MIWAIAGRELQRMLVTPLAWITLAVTQLALGTAFLLSLNELAREPRIAAEIGVTTHVVSAVMGFASVWLMLAAPLLGMRLLSEEYRSGTIRLLRTAPVPAWRIVAGKYLALLAIIALVTALASIMPASLAAGTDLDAGTLVSASLALFMLGAMYAAVSLAASSFTAQPASAAMTAFASLLLLWLLHWAGTQGIPGAALLRFLSPAGHLDQAFHGLLGTRQAASFLLLIAVSLLVAGARLALRGRTRSALLRRPHPRHVLWPGTVVLLGSVLGAGALTPVTIDLSATGRNSLSGVSREVMDGLDRHVEVIAYAPVEPELRQRIERLVAPYRRYSDRLRLSFVNPGAATGTLRRLGISGRWGLAVSSGGRTTTCGEATEACLTSALQRLSRAGDRWVAFLQGHGERPLTKASEDGLGHFESALKESGLHTRQVNLARNPQIPANTDLLLVASPQVPVTAGERNLISEYLSKGGSLMVLAEPGRDNGLAGLAREVGVLLLDGTVIYPDYRLLGTSHPAVVPVTELGPHPAAEGLSANALFAHVRPLSVDGAEGWEARTLARSLSRSWAEAGRLEGELRYDKDAGDLAGPLTLGVALRRNDGRARAAVIGDGDFLSNRYLHHGANLELGLNLVSWLIREEGGVSIQPVRPPDANISLGPSATRVLAAGFVLLLPGALLAAGLVIRRLRR